MNRKLKETKRKAKDILQKARTRAKKMVYESEIMKQIQVEADKIKQEIIEGCQIKNTVF